MVRRFVVLLLLAGCAATAPGPAREPMPGEGVASDVALLRGRFAGEQPAGNSDQTQVLRVPVARRGGRADSGA